MLAIVIQLTKSSENLKTINQNMEGFMNELVKGKIIGMLRIIPKEYFHLSINGFQTVSVNDIEVTWNINQETDCATAIIYGKKCGEDKVLVEKVEITGQEVVLQLLMNDIRTNTFLSR
jgi:hypothetical protein